jgi:membrane protease YdiL (CAAX protease family)
MTSGPARPTPIRSAIEIAALAAYLVVVPQIAEALTTAAGYQLTGFPRIAVTLGLFVGLALVAVALLGLRGESVRDVGLKRPVNTAGAVALGLVVAALIFLALRELQRTGVMGETRLGDMATELKDNLALALARAAFSLIIVGFVEEFVFRGFVFDRLAKAFGAGALAWSLALPGQAVLFGLTHAYQGVEGMLFTGAVGFVFGAVFLLAGRNLWPVIIAHGAFDAVRAVHLYLAQSASS